MSEMYFELGKFFFTDDEHSELLLDVRDYSSNKSRMHSHLVEDENVLRPLEDSVSRAVKEIFSGKLVSPGDFQGSHVSMAHVVTCLRIVARLLRKAQIHTVLRIGQPAPLDEPLEEILLQFNPANTIWRTPIDSANFLPEKFFDTVIFYDAGLPSPQVFLSAKDGGKVYFIAATAHVEELLRSHAKLFSPTKGLALFEVEISPQLRRELRRRTPQGQLEEKFSAIAQVVAKAPEVMKKFRSLSNRKKNSYLDEYIAEVVRAEYILAEIFPLLASDTIKFNFNLLKEFLIDLRLGNGNVARVLRQQEILALEFQTT